MTRGAFRCAVALGCILGTARAGIQHRRDYGLHQPRARGILFGMAITPDQSVLSYVAREDGHYRLTRVRNWLEKTPAEETIEVPGFSKSDFARPVPPWYASVLITPDGRYAVCISSGSGARAGGVRVIDFDDLISVVDLRQFKILKTIHSRDLTTDIHSIYLDRKGDLVISIDPNEVEAGTVNPNEITGGRTIPRSRGRFITLPLPDLASSAVCEYSAAVVRGRTVGQRAEADCQTPFSQRAGGPISLAQVFGQLKAAPYHSPSRFRISSHNDFHRNWWGNPVVTRVWCDVFSIGTGRKVGTLAETAHNSVEEQLSEQSGHDYLLLLEGGTKLKIYELTE